MRGVGKSTWARQEFPQAVRFDLLDEGLYQSYLREPRLFGRELARVEPGTWIVLDEVQRLPAASSPKSWPRGGCNERRPSCVARLDITFPGFRFSRE